MNQIDSLERLVNEFSKLPGVGKKTAQRYAYFLLTMNESDVKDFADAMITAKESIHYCKVCSNVTSVQGQRKSLLFALLKSQKMLQHLKR